MSDGGAPPSMRVLSELGARLDEAWQRLGYDELAFPALAAEALDAARVHRQISIADVVRWLLCASSLPEQDDLEAKFGQPPVTAYHGRRFYIQVLLWTEGTTSIHRHAFSGAFLMLEGPSLQVRYAFEPRRRVSSRLLIGDLRRCAAGLLAPGDVTPITHDLIHSTYHLEAPAATVVVRSYRDHEVAPQYEYLPPTVAHDPFFEDPATKRRLQALRLLRKTQQPGHVELAAELVARSDLHTVFVVLLDLYRSIGSAARAAPALDAARARHGAAIDDLIPVLDEDLRRRRLHRAREAVADRDERFFLALLANLPDRTSIEAVVQQRHPDADARQKIATWLEALARAGIVGLDGSEHGARERVLAMLDGRAVGDGERARLRRTAIAPLCVA
jgi:hypothetical protein